MMASEKLKCERSSNSKPKPLNSRLWTYKFQYPCSFCPMSFRTPTALEKHFQVHTGEDPLLPTIPCPHPKCVSSFGKVSSLKIHLRNVHREDETSVQCPTCKQVLANPRNLTRHQQKVHCNNNTTGQPNDSWPCQLCTKTFKSQSSLKSHVDWSHIKKDVKPFLCEWCDLKPIFKTQSALKKHVHAHHTRENPHKCPECSRSFSTSDILKSHEITHTPIDETRLIPCPGGCGKTFFSYSGARLHFRRSPACNPTLVTKNVSCPLCPQTFWSSCDLERHLVTHTRERAYSCAFCEKSFIFKTSLHGHVRLIHSREKSYRCTHPGCHRGFMELQGLKAHLQVHKTENFDCEICGKKFQHRENLKIHYKRHSSSPGVHCLFCPMKTWTKAGLRTHLQTHTKEQHLKCRKCQKPFHRSSKLKKHEEVCSETI